MTRHSEDILDSHLKAIEGAGAYHSDGWFYTRLRTRMDAIPQSSDELLTRRPSWVLVCMALLLAWNIFAIRSNERTAETRAEVLGAFVRAYETSIDSDFE